MLYTKILPPSFQRSTSESSCSSALFVSLLYQKQNELQTSQIQVFSHCQTQVIMSQLNTSKNNQKNIIITT